jgi:hypothetical protein
MSKRFGPFGFKGSTQEKSAFYIFRFGYGKASSDKMVPYPVGSGVFVLQKLFVERGSRVAGRGANPLHHLRIAVIEERALLHVQGSDRRHIFRTKLEIEDREVLNHPFFMGLDVGIALLMLRQSGLWQRLRAAPLSRTMLLGSRAVSAALIAGFILLVLFGFARIVFGVHIRGSFVGFLGVCAAFSLMTAAFGLLIAALGETVEATRGYSIMATIVMVMLGGAWVPTFLFPMWLQKLTVIIPTRWAIDGLDGMTWRGLGFSSALAPIGVLLLFTLLFGALAVTRFRWRAGG